MEHHHLSWDNSLFQWCSIVFLKLPEGIMLRQSRITSRFRMREQLFQENYEHHKRPKTAGLCTGIFRDHGGKELSQKVWNKGQMVYSPTINSTCPNHPNVGQSSIHGWHHFGCAIRIESCDGANVLFVHHHLMMQSSRCGEEYVCSHPHPKNEQNRRNIIVYPIVKGCIWAHIYIHNIYIYIY